MFEQLRQELTTKQETLQEAKETKLNQLTVKKDILLGMSDADTVRTERYGNLREQALSGARYDAVEMPHGGQYDMYGRDSKDTANDGYAKSTYAMKKQREQVANIFGKNVQDVTEQDMIDVANQQMIQKLADLVRSPGEERWIAPLVKDVVPTDLSGRYGSLNVPIGVIEVDSFDDRNAGALVNIGTGQNVTDRTARDPMLNAQYQPMNKMFSRVTPEQVEAAEEYSRYGQGKMSEIEQLAPAAASGLVRSVLDLADVTQELATYVPQVVYNKATGSNVDFDLFNDETKENLNKIIEKLVGYKAEADQESVQKAADSIAKSGFNLFDTDTWGVVKDKKSREHLTEAAVEYLTNPSLTVHGLVQIFGAGGALKGGTKLATKVLDKVNDGLGTKIDDVLKSKVTRTNDEIARVRADSTLSLADKKAKIAELADSVKKTDVLAHYVKGTSFVNADFAIRANAHITEYKENNNGEEPDLGKLASILAIDKLLATAEVYTAKNIIGADGLLKPAVKKTLTEKAKDVFGGLVVSVGEEAVQEGLDAVGEVINAKYDSEKYKDMTLHELLKANSDEILGGILAGAAGGAHMRAPAITAEVSGTLPELAKTGLTKAMEGVDNIVDKYKPEEVTQEEAVETDKDSLERLLYMYDISETPEFASVKIEDVEATIAGIDKSGLDKETVAKLDSMAEKVRSKYREAVATGSDEIKLGSSEDLMSWMGKVGLTEEDTELDMQLVRLASKAGIVKSVDEYRKIKKDYFTVEEEATIGKTGYITYGNELDALLNATNPDKELIGKKIKQMQKFSDSQEAYIEKARGFMNEIKAKIASYNKGEIKAGLLDEIVDKARAGIKANKRGNVFSLTVDVDENGKAYIVGEDNIESMIFDSKARNIKGIASKLNNAVDKLKSVGVDIAKYGIGAEPIIEIKGSMKSVLAKTAEDMKKVKEKSGKSSMKLINLTGDKGYTGELVKYNKDITNTGDYTSSDVVYITANAPKTQKEYVELVQSLAKDGNMHAEIEKAKAAGATLVIDQSLMNSTERFKRVGKKKPQTAFQTIMEAVVLYKGEQAYSPIGKSEGSKTNVKRVMKPRTEVRAAMKDRDEKAKVKKKLDAVKDSAYEQYIEGNKTVEELLEESSELREAFTQEGKDTTELLTRYFERIAKEHIAELVNKLDTIAEMSDTIKQAVAMEKIESEYTEKEIELARKELESKRVAEESVKSILRQIAELKDSYAERIALATEDERAELEVELQTEIETILGTGMDKDRAKEALDNGYRVDQDFAVLKKTENGLSLEISRKKANDETDRIAPLNVQDYVKSVGGKDPLRAIDPNMLINPEYFKDIKQWLNNMVSMFKGMDDKNKLKQKYRSPGLGLVMNNDLVVDDTVALAMQLTIDENIAFSGAMLARLKTKENVAQTLGMLETQVNNELYGLVKDKGMLAKTLANKLGAALMQKLGYGFKANENIEKEAYDKLEADLGNMMILAMIDAGIVEDTRVPATELTRAMSSSGSGAEYMVSEGAEVVFIRFTEKASAKNEAGASTVTEIRDRYKMVHELLGDEETVQRGYKTSPIVKPRHEKEQVSKDIIGTMIPKGKKEGLVNPKDFIQKLVEIEWKVNKAELYEIIDMAENNREVLLSYLGYVSDDKLTKMTKESRESAEAKNREIEKSVEDVLELAKDKKSSGKLYFDWFYTSNGRYMMDSNTINPQANKFHRFLVQPLSHTKMYRVVNDKIKIGNKDVTIEFKYALAQSMGFAVGNKAWKDIDAFATKLMEMTEKELATVRREFSEGNVEALDKRGIKVEHLSHFMQGLNALEGIKKGTFESALTAEFDAVTSGFGLKLMQFPVLGKKLWYWLNKVGVFKKDDVFMNSMNDQLSIGGMKDSYQSLGIDIDMKSAKDGIKGHVGKALWESLEDVLPKVTTDETGETVVTKELRTLFKNPFMTFNYSAGIASIKESLANVLMTKVLDSVVAGEKGYEGFANKLESLTGKNSNELIRALKEDDLSSIKTLKGMSLDRVLKDMFKESYGSQVEKIMTDNFGEFMRANATINASFRVMFDLFKEAYDKEKAKYPVGKFDEQAFKEVMDKLRPVFPLIKGPLSEGIEDGIGVYSLKTTTPDVKNVRYEPAQTLTGKDKPKTSTIRHMIKDFEAAVSAGSVIPIHYIDGALMAQLMKYDITAIHDAVMPELDMALDVVRDYNKAMVDVNMQYSLTDELIAMLDRAKTELGMSDKDFADKLDDVYTPSRPLRLWNEAKDKVDNAVKGSELLTELKRLKRKVDAGRENIAKNLSTVMHMASMEGSVYEYTKAETKQEDAIINNKKAMINEKDMDAIKVDHRMDNEASIKGKSLDELKEMLSNTENGKEMLERLDGLKELCV